MLRINLLLIILLISSIGQAQSFEGKIAYKFEIRNADPNRMPDSVFNMIYKGMPTMTHTYFYKENRYKSVAGDSIRAIQIYEPSENRIYSYTEGVEVAFWSEWSTETVIEKIDKTEIILGLECNAIIMRTSNSETTLYYPSKYKYKIDVSKFKEDNAWEKCLQETESIPLKYVLKGNGAPHIVVLTATEITEEMLGDDFFSIPKFKQIMKSPF